MWSTAALCLDAAAAASRRRRVVSSSGQLLTGPPRQPIWSPATTWLAEISCRFAAYGVWSLPIDEVNCLIVSSHEPAHVCTLSDFAFLHPYFHV